MPDAGLFDLLAPFFGLIALGVAAGRLAPRGEGPAGLAWMQVFVIRLALPCLFYRLLADRSLEGFWNGRFLAATTLATATTFGLALAAGLRATGGALREATVGAAAGAYANVGYMGPPLVLAAFGPEAAAPVILVFVGDNLLLFTLIPLLMALAGGEGRRPAAALGLALRRVLTHPFNLAIAAGLLSGATGLHPPAWMGRMIAWLAPAAAPTALFMLGLSLALSPARGLPRGVPLLVALKLVLHPLLAAALLTLVGGAPPLWVAAAVAMAALPPALNVVVVAAQYRVGLERAAACLLIGTLAATLTLPAALTLARRILDTGAAGVLR